MRTLCIVFALSFSLALAKAASAEEAAETEEGEDEDEELPLDEGVQLETGQQEGDSEYQLHGPGEVMSPEELLQSTGPSQGEGETEGEGEGEGEAEGEGEGEGEEESEVSLDLDLDETETEGELPPVHPVTSSEEVRLRWFLVPPYYQGIRGDAGVRLFFPVYFDRWSAEGQRELFVFPFYYYSRGPAQGQGADVAFPLVWSFRGPQRRTWVIGNVYWSHGSGDDATNHNGVAPFAFWGNTANASYQVGFPLFYRWRRDDGTGFTLAGLYFDHRREGDAYRRGFFPLVWIGESHGRGYGLGLPLVYHFWDRGQGETTTVVPPVAVRHYADGYGFSLAPLFFLRRRDSASSVTLFPLFYYGWNGEGRSTFISPLAWYHRHTGTRMGGALLYHFTRRPDSRFDGFIPLYLRGSNSREGSRWQYIFPVLFTGSDPVTRRTVVFPVVWDFENTHQSRTTVILPLMAHYRRLDERRHTTWVVPTFQYSVRPDGYSFNFHPLVYINRDGPDRSHQVVAPLFWRFARPDSTSTVFFPFYWDFTRGDSRTSIFFPFVFRGTSPNRQWTAVLNTVYTTGQRRGVPYWTFNFFPLFRVARPSPNDIEWQILLGLAGYGRRGSRRWVDVFWVPVPVGESEELALSSDESPEF